MTTTVGIFCNDGIVLAADHRATMGHLISCTHTPKIHQIDKNIGMTLAGSVGDALKLVKILKVESKLYKIQRGEQITIKAATNLLSNILNSNRHEPYQIQFILGGIDKNGFQLYSLDAIGGIIGERNIVSTGSGSPIAYGILESEYKNNMSIEDGIKVAEKAIMTAQLRDSASGNGCEIVTITKDGYSKR